MKEITVISGKGGTGKTSVAASFAALCKKGIFTDCDVDAANLSLIMRPVLQEKHEFKASCQARILQDRCSACGLCRELCRFQAISEDFQVDPLSCEGCGVCHRACPEEAVAFEEVISGHWFVSRTPYGPLVHARLGIAQENSGKLVTQVRTRAREMAQAEDKRWIIHDGPPGIGCPVIASLSGAAAALVVTEPTLSAVHDMERVLAVCRHFQVPSRVCINRWDLDEENTRRIQDYCETWDVPLAGLIPQDNSVTAAMLKGLPVVEYNNGPAARKIKAIWSRLITALSENDL